MMTFGTVFKSFGIGKLRIPRWIAVFAVGG